MDRSNLAHGSLYMVGCLPRCDADAGPRVPSGSLSALAVVATGVLGMLLERGCACAISTAVIT